MITHLAICGGGVKGCVLLGALEALDDTLRLSRIKHIIGSSVGGGMMEIVKIDNFDVDLKGTAGKYLSLVVCHDQNPEVLKEIRKKLNKLDIKVVDKKQTNYGKQTLSVLSLDGRRIRLPEVVEIEKTTEGIEFIRSLSKLQK